jgi:hypothetical protein
MDAENVVDGACIERSMTHLLNLTSLDNFNTKKKKSDVFGKFRWTNGIESAEAVGNDLGSSLVSHDVITVYSCGVRVDTIEEELTPKYETYYSSV